MTKMLGSDAILRSLEAEGVDVCFGIPGGAILPTYDAFARGTTVRHILARLKVGNSYINRSMIGAVVGVQPFGGEGLSGTGPKAGGPRYLHRFATERSVSTDTTAAGGNASLLSLQEEE